ncbi:MAG: CobD/CbiB family cobalamin biosynthesis protein [Actinomycetes bacterium]
MGHVPDACGLLAGYVSDLLFADPERAHPVAAFGACADRVHRAWYADATSRGVLSTAVLVGASAGLGLVAERAGRGPLARATMTGLATWAVLGGRSLHREAEAMSRLLQAGDSAGAGSRLPHRCGRDPAGAGSRLPHVCGRERAGLDVPDLARATVESVAENTCDAVVAPLFWGAVAGTPGLLAYRATNTLDAMVGHRSPRYARFGTAAARLDDAANFLPARLTGLLAAAFAGLVGGSARTALRTMRRDGPHHPSPNAGRVEAAFAGALGVALGGRTVYAGRVEQRGPLGQGRTVQVADIARATRLANAVGLAAALLAAAAAGARGRSR